MNKGRWYNKDALAAAEVPENIAKALMGHADKGVHAAYGSGPPLSVLKSAVAKIKYQVDFDGVLK